MEPTHGAPEAKSREEAFRRYHLYTDLSVLLVVVALVLLIMLYGDVN